MPTLDWQTFVLQRRINRPPTNVVRTITNPAVFGPGSVLSCDRDGELRLDDPFRRIDSYAHPVWRACGRVVGAHGHKVAAVEIEVSPWSEDLDTQLLLRPRVRNPQRWSGPRLRRYFAHAHRRVDDLTHLLLATTPADASDMRA